MNEQKIVERILSDAENEAKSIISEAEESAKRTIDEANTRKERNLTGTMAEVKVKCDGIYDGKAAAARLDGAKILLAEKRGVIDEVYARALKQLLELGESDALHLTSKLLEENAEEGDEIVFAENFKHIEKASALPVIKERNLKVSNKRADIDGGFILLGKVSDKDLSYGAILSADREAMQAEIAVKIFN